MNELEKLFRRLQTNTKCVLFTEENINDKLLRKIWKPRYKKGIEFIKLFDRNAKFLEDEKRTHPIKITVVEKKRLCW